MRLKLPSHAGGKKDQFMSFPNKNQPLPPVPTSSKLSSTSQKLNQPSSLASLSSTEWSPASSRPNDIMGPPQPPPGRFSDSKLELNQNLVRPTTVDGAVDWINRHKPQIDQFLTLLEKYPQLVQSERLDKGKNPLPPIKRSISESSVFPPSSKGNQNYVNRRLDSRLRRKKHVSLDKIRVGNEEEQSPKSNGDSRYNDLVTGERYIYVCDVLSENNASLSQSSGPFAPAALPSVREKIVTALSSYCFVRTGPDRLHSEAEFVELTHTIANADAFIILLNDRVLSSGTCFHQLAVAAAYDVPIISVKEAGFKLAEPLAPELHEIEIVPKRFKVTTVRDSTSKKENEKKLKDDNPDLHESQSSGFHSDSDGEDSKQTLAELITDCYNDSILYAANFHSSCISKLLGKLSEYLGEAYLDFEVSQQSREDVTALINDRMMIPRIGHATTTIEFPSMNRGALKVTRNLRERSESTSSMPSKQESANLSETPMSLDRSSSTPHSFSKLPPILKTSEETRTRANEEASKLDTRGTIGTSSDRLSPDESVDPRESQCTGRSSFLDWDNSDWDLTPEGSPFMETKYVVFPSSDDLGFEKRPPFTVNFPHDISTIDRRRSSTSIDDYGFNYVQLDFKYDVVAPSPVGFVLSDEEEEEEPPKQPAPKKEVKPRVKKQPPKPIQVQVRNNRPVREQQLVKMATISIKYGMPV